MTNQQFRSIITDSQKRVKKSNEDVEEISKSFEATLRKLSMIL